MSILINATKSGNGLSFDELYEQYHIAIGRHVARRLTDDSELVEDVCQEVWIAVWQHLSDAVHPTPTWLYRIATTRTIDAWRRKYHVQPSRGKGPKPLPLSLDACNEDGIPLSEMIADEASTDPAESDRVDIEQALSKLPPHEQQILNLRAYGYALREIRAYLGISYRMTLAYANSANADFRRAYQEEEVA